MDHCFEVDELILGWASYLPTGRDDTYECEASMSMKRILLINISTLLYQASSEVACKIQPTSQSMKSASNSHTNIS